MFIVVIIFVSLFVVSEFTFTESARNIQSPTKPTEDSLARDNAVKEALKNAWMDYGIPKRKSEIQKRPDRKWVWNRHLSEGKTPTMLPPGFQPTTSEWDSLVTSGRQETEVLTPGLVNHILSAGIFFQLNHYETLDRLQKFGIATLIGVFITLWMVIGISICSLPVEMALTEKEREKLLLIERHQGTESWRFGNLDKTVSVALNRAW